MVVVGEVGEESAVDVVVDEAGEVVGDVGVDAAVLVEVGELTGVEVVVLVD